MKNPYLRAFAASGYIGLIALFFMFAPHLESIENTVLAPLLMLSLLTFSVAMMGYLFFYEPATLLLDGKRDAAVSSFFRMAVTFAIVTAVLLGIALIV